MCGIVGIINGSEEIKPKLGSIFDNMLWADQLRGVDGAGVFWFDAKKDHYNVVKDEDMEVVTKDKDYRSALLWVEHKPFIIGHNRSATRGKISTENNHPFDEGNVVLVHNGTMTHIPKEYDDGTNVDSHAIAKMLHDASPQEFMKKSFGAYALVWFDKLSRKLNILRNSQRPLSLVHFKDFILISSEPLLAAWCASRNGYTYEKIEDVKEHTLYEYEPFKIKEPVITDLSSLKSFPHTPAYDMDDDDVDYGVMYGNYENWWINQGYTKETQRRNRQLVIVPNDSDTVIEEKRDFSSISPWKHFEMIHRLPPQQSGGLTAYRKGDWIDFEMDGGQEHDSFTSFLAKIPGKDDYFVRGNINLTLDQLTQELPLWRGQISDIKTKHNKVTIYVKDVFNTANMAEEDIAEKQLAG